MIKIQRATLSDIDKIVEFYRKTAKFEQTVNSHISLDGVDSEDFRANVAREILLSDFRYVFAVEDNEILGFISWYLKEKNRWWTYEKNAYIDHLFVEEKSRGKGIARILMEDFEAWAREKGADLVTIEVLPENENAEKIYRHLGYDDHMVHLHKKL